VTVLAIAGFAAAVAVGLLAVGPFAMDVLFGADYAFERIGLALVGWAWAATWRRGTLNQAALARGRQRQAAAAWAIAAVALVVWLLLPASTTSCCARGRLSRGDRAAVPAAGSRGPPVGTSHCRRCRRATSTSCWPATQRSTAATSGACCRLRPRRDARRPRRRLGSFGATASCASSTAGLVGSAARFHEEVRVPSPPCRSMVVAHCEVHARLRGRSQGRRSAASTLRRQPMRDELIARIELFDAARPHSRPVGCRPRP
jgi:hypothetical protein